MRCQNCGKETGQRTLPQNNALYKFFALMAKALNDAGHSQRDVFEKAKAFDVPITKEFIHDLWIYFQKAMFKTEHTRDLKKTEEIDAIHKVMNRNIGETLHIDYVPFPSVCEKCKHIDCVCLEKMFNTP